MKRSFFRAAAACACLLLFSATAWGQQPAPKPRRGGLDNLSLPSTAEHAAAAAAASRWQVFAPEGAGFSVLLPGVPTEATRRGREEGRLAAEFRDYKLKADGVDYEVTRTGQIPAEAFAAGGFADNFFKGLSSTLALNTPGRGMKLMPAGERAVRTSGFEGREYDLASAGERARVRVYLVNRAIFAVAMTGPESAFTEEKAERFFGSLALTGQ